MDMNPRSWKVEIIDYRPGLRLSLKLTIPWRVSASRKMPLTYHMKIWHKDRKEGLHQHLIEVNRILVEAERRHCKMPQPLFYDSLTHALVYPHDTVHPHVQDWPFNLSDAWMKQMLKAFQSLRSA